VRGGSGAAIGDDEIILASLHHGEDEVFICLMMLGPKRRSAAAPQQMSACDRFALSSLTPFQLMASSDTHSQGRRCMQWKARLAWLVLCGSIRFQWNHDFMVYYEFIN